MLGDKLTEYNDNEKLAEETLKMCYNYWKMYMRLCQENDVTIPAVVWVQNDITGHMMVFTRGEHASDLKKFINDLW